MKKVLTATICFAIPLLPSSASADAVSEFYKGNTITIIAATGAGSAYGLHGRLLADAIRKNIPGNPKVVMQFMPGGGGAKQANYLYNVAPKNGTVIGFPLKYIAVNQMMGRKGLKYDAGKFSYLGSLGPINSVVAILKEKAPAYTLEGVKKTEVIMGATGKSSETFITPTLMNNLLGTKFKIVTGYRGMKGVDLAMERGELHGRAGSWDSMKSGQANWLDKNLVSIIALSGLSRNWDLRNVPTLIDLAETAEQKSVLEFFGSGNAVGWLFITPPSVPAARVAALRSAFDATTSDPSYVSKVRARNLDIQPKSGKEVERIIRKTLSASPALINRIKSAMELK
jgi:tripartite-type tricarboxylate transporter receptor subunit TctC